MARDYFSDIQDDPQPPPRRMRPNDAPAPSAPPTPSSERSIRNISVPSRRQMTPPPPPPPKVGGNDIRIERNPSEGMHFGGSVPRRPRVIIMWVAAIAGVLILGVAGFFLLWNSTKVTVTPRTHQVTFDPSTQFTAYPANSAAAGAITYTVQSNTFEDSMTVPATGVEKAEDRASGTVTVFNEHSTSPVRLIKNTRFETSNGLIFRIPASVDVPGMKGATAGQVTVTMFADQPGPDYNIGPTDRFMLPGLKSSPDMYAKVYARSSSAFSGGFIGEKPAVSPQALEGARAELRSRLAEKARGAAMTVSSGFTFPELIRISYESLPTTADPAGGARVNEKALVQIPIFPSDNFAQSIARAVSADASDSPVSLRPQTGFGAKPIADASVTPGDGPLSFTLAGSALVVWDVDTQAIAEALAGREQGAFETIIATFSGIDKAHANIAPFWSSKFPAGASDIKIEILEPEQQ